jgi:hypothetical protein
VALLVGCHTSDYNSKKQHPDASGSAVDGGATFADARVLPDAMFVPGAASITVDDTGLDVSTTAVHKMIFQHQDGTVFFETDPDGTGTASHQVVQGDMITVATVFTQNNDGSIYTYYDLYTVTGVKPGDHLIYPDAGVGLPYNPIGDAQVSVTAYNPTLPPDASVPSYYYAADVGCGFNYIYYPTSPTDFTLQPQCVSSTNMVHALGAVSDQSSNLLATAFASGAWSASPDAGYQTIALSLDSWTSATGFGLTLSNAPTSSEQYAVTTTLSADGLRFALPTLSGAIVPGGGASLNIPFDATTFADVDYLISVRGQGQMQTYEETVPSTTRALDLGASFLPRLIYTSVDTFGDARPEIRWFSDGDLSAADGGALTLSYDNTYWTVIVPGSQATSFKVPALPSDIDPNFAPPASVNPSSDVIFIESSAVSGYDAFRPSAPSLVNGPSKGATVRTTTFSVGGG